LNIRVACSLAQRVNEPTQEASRGLEKSQKYFARALLHFIKILRDHFAPRSLNEFWGPPWSIGRDELLRVRRGTVLPRQATSSDGNSEGSCVKSFSELRVGVGRKRDHRRKTGAAFWAEPNVTSVLVAPILGPYGRNQLSIAVNATNQHGDPHSPPETRSDCPLQTTAKLRITCGRP
jgi:hypothetical protein